MTGAFQQRTFRLVAAVFVAVKLWLVSALPVFAVGVSPHDDRLFLRLANTFLDGQWLGAYNHFTLIKGPAYPVFIGGTVALGIPLPLAQHLLYILACWAVIRALRPLLANDWWALGLFVVLLWQPMSYQMPNLGRVLRQNFYTPCTLLVFAGFAALYTRATTRARVRVAWALLLGVAWGALWLTREESVWIVPGTILLAIVGIAFATLRSAETVAGLGEAGPGSPTPATGIGSRCRRAAWPLLVATVAGALPILAVCTMNARNYGWWGTVEMRASQFIAAYGALNRVQVGPDLTRVPLSRAGRQAIYEVSPAFAELRPWLEGEPSENYARHSASATGLDPALREIAGGWWIWVLRDAVHASGHAPSAGEALAFYQRIADEVNAACDRGDLPAAPPRATLLPRWNSGYTAALWREFPRAIGHLATFTDFAALSPPSDGNAEPLRLFRDLTQWFLSPATDAPVFNTPTATIARSYRVAVLHQLGLRVRWLYTAVIVVGVLGWMSTGVCCLWRRAFPSYAWWYAAAVLGTVIAIVFVNLLVHVTSFPNISPAAFAQAYPLVLLFAGGALAELVRTFRVTQTR
jgi:hypothetical protein